MEAFLRQEAAWKYVERISDPKERLLTEIAVARALSFLAADPEYRRTVSVAQLDLLLYARTVHELFGRADVLERALDGTITTIDDLDPFSIGSPGPGMRDDAGLSRQAGQRETLAAVVDRELGAVTFVRDYVQMHFDGPTINAYVLPSVTADGGALRHDDPGYRDALCARIEATVRAAYVDPGEQLRIEFSDSTSVAISLRSVDRTVAEAAVYHDALTKEWASW